MKMIRLSKIKLRILAEKSAVNLRLTNAATIAPMQAVTVNKACTHPS